MNMNAPLVQYTAQSHSNGKCEPRHATSMRDGAVAHHRVPRVQEDADSATPRPIHGMMLSGFPQVTAPTCVCGGGGGGSAEWRWSSLDAKALMADAGHGSYGDPLLLFSWAT